jgi:hypothetical protein
MSAHGNGIALVFARTETDWFQRWIFPTARAILFVSGRIHFYRVDGSRAKGNAGSPSALVAYGTTAANTLFSSSLHGKLSGSFIDLQ